MGKLPKEVGLGVRLVLALDETLEEELGFRLPTVPLTELVVAALIRAQDRGEVAHEDQAADLVYNLVSERAKSLGFIRVTCQGIRPELTRVQLNIERLEHLVLEKGPGAIRREMIDNWGLLERARELIARSVPPPLIQPKEGGDE